jgi:dihydroxyacetone kinase
MAGCSVTVTMLDDEIDRYWAAPVHTPYAGAAKQCFPDG